jgi:hypothetical protein
VSIELIVLSKRKERITSSVTTSWPIILSSIYFTRVRQFSNVQPLTHGLGLTCQWGDVCQRILRGVAPFQFFTWDECSYA